jgi:hypothetical protein
MFTFRLLDDLIWFLDPLFDVTGCDVEVTWLAAIDLNAEVRAPLTRLSSAP